MIGLLYDQSSYFQSLYFKSLAQTLPAVGFECQDFRPFATYSHIIVYEDSYEVNKEILNKHQELGNKVIVYTPFKKSETGEKLVISSFHKTNHFYIPLTVSYQPKMKVNKISSMCWAGDKSEIDYLEKILLALELNPLPFYIISKSDSKYFEKYIKLHNVKFISATFDNSFWFQPENIFISSNINEHLVLECAVRGIPCITVTNGKIPDVLKSIQLMVPEHCKPFCKLYTSVSEARDVIELWKMSPGTFEPILGSARSFVLENRLTTKFITDFAELLSDA